MSLAEAREQLARSQAMLVRALVAGDPVPPDFEAARVNVAAEALAHKRNRGVQRAWPVLTAVLGDDFEPRFAAYCRDHPLPRQGGPLADGHAFACHLTRRGQFPPAARLELMGVQLRFRETASGLVSRRGLALKCVRHVGRWVLAVRWSGRGEWWVRLAF